MSSVVLITGVSRYLGGQLAAQLAADPSVDRVIGVDSALPGKADLLRLGRTEFVRADIRNPLIAKVIAQARVDTVVHAAAMGTMRGAAGGRAPTTELNLVGTMQLLAACQRSESVARVVVKSTTAVYGSGSRDPGIFTEDMAAVGQPRDGYARDAVDVEGYVRGFMRRRPDIVVSVLRFASLIGPTVESLLTRYLAMPVVPTSLGFDPRLQLLHESDGVEVLRLATMTDHAGVYNIAADGIVYLSQAVRRAGRVRLPVPASAISLVGGIVRNSGVIEFSAEQASFLNFGRVVDTSRLRTEFGYPLRYSTEQALRSYLDGRSALGEVG
ncbi:MAG TPA: NAD-dependent epimerase/dehydratase family protein [Jatrophihabitantaceae bacterium]